MLELIINSSALCELTQRAAFLYILCMGFKLFFWLIFNVFRPIRAWVAKQLGLKPGQRLTIVALCVWVRCIIFCSRALLWFSYALATFVVRWWRHPKYGWEGWTMR
jgi:hypothetical protein